MGKRCGLIVLTFAFALRLGAQAPGPAAAPAHLIVTLGHVYGAQAPTLTANDLVVTEHYDPLTITSLTPLRGALELYILVDNCSTCEPGAKFTELRRFILSQPAATSVGVAYIQDGKLQIAETPGMDRERAAKAVNAPTQSKPSDPFTALSTLIQGWKPTSARRAVLMISTGIDPGAEAEGFRSNAAEKAIETAERAGVSVYAIYHPAADYATTDFSKIYAGQVLLSHVANETGGESYFLGFGPLPVLAPFLADLNEHLTNQYLLEFLTARGDAPGSLQEVTVKSKLRDVDVMTPYKAVVGGVSPGHK